MSEKHFYEQEGYTNLYLIPYLSKTLNIPDNKKLRLLDVGCAEGGSVLSLTNHGFHCDGIEIDEGRANIAKAKNPNSSAIFVADITNIADLSVLKNQYDIIIMRDVIEHIYNKKSALKNLHSFLNDNGFMFVAFPLKYSPYAGHQQTSNTWLKYMIYILLYPSFLRRFLCKVTNEENRIEELLYLRKCALTYRKFKKLIQEDWKIHDVKFFISRPIYKQRFGWPIVKMINIPILRELSNGCELIIKKNHNIV